jgi:hypothetical protein
MAVNWNMKGIPPILQFPGLPLDVNSLWKEFQACFLKNDSIMAIVFVARSGEGAHLVIYLLY